MTFNNDVVETTMRQSTKQALHININRIVQIKNSQSQTLHRVDHIHNPWQPLDNLVPVKKN